MTPDLYGVDESAWRALFSQDDACTARKLLATQNDTQAAWIRKMALAADPHPNGVLDVLFTDAPPEAGWLYDWLCLRCVLVNTLQTPMVGWVDAFPIQPRGQH